MRKKLKTTDITICPDELALVIHFEVEATILDSSNNPLHVEKKPNSKKLVIHFCVLAFLSFPQDSPAHLQRAHQHPGHSGRNPRKVSPDPTL